MALSLMVSAFGQKTTSFRGIYADFSATPLQGTAPITVQFTDESTGNPTVWIWDFQNDGINDAFIQNPSFTYEKEGNYTVKLIVMNASEDDTLVKADYITIDTSLIDQGLVAYYPFSGNANDTSGNGNHGAVSGATLTTDRFGYTSSAYHFDGSDDRISIPVNINVSVLPKLTMVAWVKPESISPVRAIISHDNGDFDREMNIDNRGVPTGYCAFTGGYGGWGIFGSFPATVDHWDMITVEYDQTEQSLKLYKGTTSMTWGASIGNGKTYTYIGASPAWTGGGSFWDGDIDDVRLYNRILPDEEVIMLFEKSPIKIPEICIVSVTPEDHNEVVWEKQPLDLIGSYTIYRETAQANVYEMIGSVTYEDSSIFVDMNSDPQQQAYKYKISAVDTLGNETVLSNYQKTIHLTIDAGQPDNNLIWSPYEGFQFDKYYIYRGIYPDSLTLLDSVPGSLTSYADINPPGGQLYYAIETINEEECNLGKDRGYARSRSNVQNNGVVGRKDNPGTGIRIFPNPANDVLTIQFNKNEVNAELVLYTIHGKAIFSKKIHQEKTNINLERLNPGVFIIQLEYDHNLLTRKLIVY